MGSDGRTTTDELVKRLANNGKSYLVKYWDGMMQRAVEARITGCSERFAAITTSQGDELLVPVVHIQLIRRLG
jgi:hypothetical protein